MRNYRKSKGGAASNAAMQPFEFDMTEFLPSISMHESPYMPDMSAMQEMQGMQDMQGVQGMQSTQVMQGMQGMQGMQSMPVMPWSHPASNMDADLAYMAGAGMYGAGMQGMQMMPAQQAMPGMQQAMPGMQQYQYQAQPPICCPILMQKQCPLMYGRGPLPDFSSYMGPYPEDSGLEQEQTPGGEENGKT